MEGIVGSAPAVLVKYAVPDTALVISHIIAQLSEESGAGLEMTENLNYSEQGLLNTWPLHFTGTMAARYAHNPRMIADVAYGGRMGNAPPPSDDGWNYRGQGLSQLTGKSNYLELFKVSGLDVVSNPGLLTAPATAFECAVADYVKVCGCLPFAEADDIVNETKHLNGGLIGLTARQQWLIRCKAVFGGVTQA